MNLNPSELAYVRSLGLFIKEKCDGCQKVLNQAHRYTVQDRKEVFCSAECRDTVFFQGKPTTPRRMHRIDRGAIGGPKDARLALETGNKTL